MCVLWMNDIGSTKGVLCFIHENIDCQQKADGCWALKKHTAIQCRCAENPQGNVKESSCQLLQHFAAKKNTRETPHPEAAEV